MAWVLGIVGFLSVVVIFVTLMVVYDEFERFSDLPDEIAVKPGKYIEYTRIVMKFKNWKSLFEMNPLRFMFVDSSGDILDLKKLEGNFRRANPCFRNESREIYLIDFRFWSYFQYFFYMHKIYDKISYVTETKMTQTVAEEMQKKIQAMLDESQKKIEESLKTQKEIVLRLNTGESVTVDQTDKGE